MNFNLSEHRSNFTQIEAPGKMSFRVSVTKDKADEYERKLNQDPIGFIKSLPIANVAPTVLTVPDDFQPEIVKLLTEYADKSLKWIMGSPLFNELFVRVMIDLNNLTCPVMISIQGDGVRYSRKVYEPKYLKGSIFHVLANHKDSIQSVPDKAVSFVNIQRVVEHLLTATDIKVLDTQSKYDWYGYGGWIHRTVNVNNFDDTKMKELLKRRNAGLRKHIKDDTLNKVLDHTQVLVIKTRDALDFPQVKVTCEKVGDNKYFLRLI